MDLFSVFLHSILTKSLGQNMIKAVRYFCAIQFQVLKLKRKFSNSQEVVLDIQGYAILLLFNNNFSLIFLLIFTAILQGFLRSSSEYIISLKANYFHESFLASFFKLIKKVVTISCLFYQKLGVEEHMVI